MRYLPVFLFILISAAPLAAQAAPVDFFGPILPDACKCENVQTIDGESGPISTAPGWGCVLQVIQNLIRLAISLGIVLATLALVYAGFTWMTSGANPGRREQGRTLLINVLVGLFVMLSAWLVVDFVMKTLYDGAKGGFGPWNSILAGTGNDQCLVARMPDAITTGVVPILFKPATGPGAVKGPNLSGTDGCPSCVALKDYGIACQANGCNVDPRLAAQLAAMKRSYTGSWTVTEGYPQSRKHQNACHKQGTCVDADFLGSGYTVENFRAFNQSARAAGIRAVFESSDCAEVQRAASAGMEAACYGRDKISGSHFSLYGTQ